MIMCRKMRSWTHKTLSLRILFLQQNRYHSSSQHICDHLPMPNWKLSPKGGSGCLLLCQSPLSQAGNSGGWCVLITFPEPLHTAGCPQCLVGWRARWTKPQPTQPHGCLEVLLHALQHFCFAMLLLSCFPSSFVQQMFPVPHVLFRSL